MELESEKSKTAYVAQLRQVVRQLPAGSGALRREVYEEARHALVNQVKAECPPLPAKDVVRRRLVLEDCIRQVEHEILLEDSGPAAAGHTGRPLRN
ncbi:MAG TPA: hypothetical protein VMW31_03675 [Devosiaceae bacterium]|nr:hypothetical protein [Devosiaceae bacterium]